MICPHDPESVVFLDGRRRPAGPPTSVEAPRAAQANGRRRLIDPAANESDAAAAELEFQAAMQEYKRQSGRMFPTWSEVLEVLRGLGYVKVEAGAREPRLAS